MPTSITDLLTTVKLDVTRLKTVKWGQTVNSSSKGIYFISTSANPSLNANLFDMAPIDESILNFWISKIKTIQIDGIPNPKTAGLKQRLNEFWLPDENILYIGQTESGGGLKNRINQYYRTELGERKPHAGGHWIKTLKPLNELFVHYIATVNPPEFEENLLRNFILQVSDVTKGKLRDSKLPLPFANLELERGNRKQHGIAKSKLGGQ